MKLDVRITPTNDMRADADLILLAERLGFSAAWVVEQRRNPFFSLTIAAKESTKIQLGAYRAATFPRSPMISAQIAWDLARQSSGRFPLSLDALEAPGASGGRLREYIESLRAIWHTFQTGERLRYRGQHYTFRLMAPFFNPGPIAYPHIQIYLHSLDSAIAELAGALCQGLHVSETHSADHIRQVIKPAVNAGLQASGRASSDFSLAVPVMIASGKGDAEIRQARQRLKLRIAQAAKTAAFRRIAAHHNWALPSGDGESRMREQDDDRLAQLMPDDYVDAIAIVAPPHDVLKQIEARYAGLADRVSLTLTRENRALIEAIVAAG
ncbi:MAG: LLM class flavin-dependent oxidoreductase [Chloroflexi bacterium]|nr:LLM class flavin-dependent oxidoreductase [Chloroflexota bacterium]